MFDYILLTAFIVATILLFLFLASKFGTGSHVVGNHGAIVMLVIAGVIVSIPTVMIYSVATASEKIKANQLYVRGKKITSLQEYYQGKVEMFFHSKELNDKERRILKLQFDIDEIRDKYTYLGSLQPKYEKQIAAIEAKIKKIEQESN